MGHHDQEQDEQQGSSFPGKDRPQDVDEMAGGGMSGDTGGGMAGGMPGEDPGEGGMTGGYGESSGFGNDPGTRTGRDPASGSELLDEDMPGEGGSDMGEQPKF
jgi:hypothetical protein